jgi:hypothetical protein
MERHNNFDEAIKAKLGGLEDEPSARVWAGVRNEVGLIRPPQSKHWPMRIAAAIALLCATGLGYYLLMPADHALPTGMAVHRAKRIVIEPADREGRKGIYLAQKPHNEQQLHDTLPGRKDQMFANAPRKPKSMPQDSLKTLRQMPMPEDNKIEIVHHDAPKNLELQAPNAPDQRVPQNPEFDRPEVRVETAIASASTKRSFKVPGRDDITSDNLKRKSGAILGAITNGANSFLGLNASYEEKNQEDQKLTAFNADFGLFKIKRVRTIKN